MSITYRRCYLECTRDRNLRIYLPHMTRVYIGTTHPPNPCAELDAHIIATADLETARVCIENISRGTTWCKRRLMDLHEQVFLRHGELVGLEKRRVVYQVKFYPRGSFYTMETKGKAKMFSSKEVEKPDPPKIPKGVKGEWETVPDTVLVYKPPLLNSSSMIAGFSLLDTIIKVRDARLSQQWDLAFEEIPERFKKLVKDGYTIVIMTDNLLTSRLTMSIFKKKVARLIRGIGVSLLFVMALNNGLMKKPAPGLWYEYRKRVKIEEINTTKSFFVGSLAGRTVNWADDMPPDRSSADRYFAVNTGLHFITPEEYFLDWPIANYRFPLFNPFEFILTHDFVKYESVISKNQEIVVLVGPPISGKSWICKHILVPSGYIQLPIRTTSIARCGLLRKLDQHIKNGKSVVIDGMNHTVRLRKIYIEIAQRNGKSIRCLEMNCPPLQLIHNRRFREITQQDINESDNRLEQRMRHFRKHYETPDVNEGFSEIRLLNFIPTFNDAFLNCLYSLFLVVD